MRPLKRRGHRDPRASQTPPDSGLTADERADQARAKTPNEAKPPHRRKIEQGDTFAWLLAALQVLPPILAVLIIVILLAYGFVYFLFLR